MIAVTTASVKSLWKLTLGKIAWILLLLLMTKTSSLSNNLITRGCRAGAVVRALASHQCGPGSIPRSGVICGLSLLVVYLVPRGFLCVLRVPLSSEKIKLVFDLICVNY